MNLKEFQNQILPIKNKLFRFALSIVGNAMEAEDVVQEVFIKLWQNRGELKQLKNAESWSMKLTRNLSIDKLRSKHRKAGELGETIQLPSAGPTPYQLAERSDTVGQIEKILQELSPKQRQLVQLRDMEGMSYQEISDITNLPLNQVKITLFRARKAIRAKLLKTESYGL